MLSGAITSLYKAETNALPSSAWELAMAYGDLYCKAGGEFVSDGMKQYSTARELAGLMANNEEFLSIISLHEASCPSPNPEL